MEFDEQKYKVVGLIKKELGGSSAEIKVIALLSENNKLIQISQDEIRSYFPPKGYVFEPGFFYNYNYKVDDFISFKVEKNDRAREGDDEYRLNTISSELNEFGLKACRVNGFEKKALTTNLNLLSLAGNISGTFYGITDKYIIGKLKINSIGKIEPIYRSRIHLWDLDDANILYIDNKYRLVNEPQEGSLILDCMDDKQLFEWFRTYLKRIQPDYVSLLDHNAIWRTELPKMFAAIDYEKLEADKIRLKRIEEKFDLLELFREEIISLTEGSEKFKKVFTKSLEKHIEEFNDKYTKELEEFKTEIDQQKRNLNSQISDLIKQKLSKDKTLRELTESVELTKEKLNELKSNKARIIQDFSIIKDVLQESRNNVSNSNIEIDSFVVEDIKNNGFDEVDSIDQFKSELQYQLFKNKINPNFAQLIYKVTSLYDIILTKDIRIGLSLAKATNNAKYIIQQVEPDWLHFRDLWSNGLGKIWESAYNSPETPHFLLLEDINMSAVECYCRPLLDIVNGIRYNISYGKTPFPKNLKIFATYISFNDPAIGLPIYKKTFENCGALGFRGNLYSTPNIIRKRENTFVKSSFFNRHFMDDFEIEEVRNGVTEEMNEIFLN